MKDDSLLELVNLHVHFPIYGGILRHQVAEVKAVDGVSFELKTGETLGLVGESGSGKTTVGRAIINLLKPTVHGVHLSGEINFRSSKGIVNLNGLRRREMLPYRSEIAMVFQDPYSSLNPRMTVMDIVAGPMKIHLSLTRTERKRRVLELLDRVGLQAQYAERYPHEFSGGQRQRIGLARALSTHPKLIIGDEPVSALDVSVQAQVINLMQELQEEFDLTYLFIAHDLSVVYHASDRIAVMYLGNIVELGDAQAVYDDPRHPYAQALLSAVPRPDPRRQRAERIRLEGDIPTPLRKPSGCGFRTRCWLAQESCAAERPELAEHGSERLVACPVVKEAESASA